MKCLLLLISVSTFILITAFAAAQNKTSGHVGINQNPDQTYTRFKNDPSLSSEGQELLNEINNIKDSNDPSRKNELELLLNMYNKKNGLTEITAIPENNSEIIFYPQNNTNNADLNIGQVYSGHSISIATATEQAGTSKGRAWVAVVKNAAPNFSPDTMNVYWTDDGYSYSLFSSVILLNRFVINDIDMEIVEKAGGEKFMWILYSLRHIEGSNIVIEVNGTVLDLNQQGGTNFKLHWPGQAASDFHYDVHITSDNSVDTTSTWLYIACSVDSISPNGNILYCQKFAYISQTTQLGLPAVTYRANILPVYWQSNAPWQSGRILYSDIAYFKDGSNQSTLMFTYSNIPDSTKIWLTKSSITGNNAALLGTLGSNMHIKYAKIAAPGGFGNQQLMVVAAQNWQNSGDWDLISFKTNNSGLNWESKFIESSTSTTAKLPSWPELFCKRGVVNKFYSSYILGSGTPITSDSVMLSKSVISSQNNWEAPLKTSILSSPGLYSKVGFLGQTADDCFVVWTAANPQSNVYATFCMSPNDVREEIQSPDKYQLTQNYPNPFNPSTRIKFRISVPGFVSLKVYDVLGKEVATLVNEEKPTGNYTVSLDATGLPSGVYYYKLSSGSYVETKKMVLIK